MLSLMKVSIIAEKNRKPATFIHSHMKHLKKSILLFLLTSVFEVFNQLCKKRVKERKLSLLSISA